MRLVIKGHRNVKASKKLSLKACRILNESLILKTWSILQDVKNSLQNRAKIALEKTLSNCRYNWLLRIRISRNRIISKKIERNFILAT